MSRLENVFRNSKIFPEFHLTARQISSYQTGEALLIFSFTENGKKRALPCAVPQGCGRLRRPEFLDIQHIKMVSLWALGTGRLCPVISVVSVRCWFDPWAVVRP